MVQTYLGYSFAASRARESRAEKQESRGELPSKLDSVAAGAGLFSCSQNTTVELCWAWPGFYLSTPFSEGGKSKHLNKVKFCISSTMLSFGLTLLRKWRCEFTCLDLDCTQETRRYKN